MKPEDVRKALVGHTDLLKPAYEEHKKFFERLACIRCGGKVSAIVNNRLPFKGQDILPNYLAKCCSCGCEFEPYTRIEVKGPDAPRGV